MTKIIAKFGNIGSGQNREDKVGSAVKDVLKLKEIEERTN